MNRKAILGLLMAGLLTSVAASTAQAGYKVWWIQCSNGAVWHLYDTLDDEGFNPNDYNRYYAAAKEVEANYRSQFPNLHFDVGTDSSPPRTNPCGGSGGYVPPTCKYQYGFYIYQPGYGWRFTGYVYASQAIAQSVENYLSRNGYHVYGMYKQCIYPGR